MAGAKDPRSANLDFLVKAATVTLGALFTLGFLISNAQLMQLGIADFSGLQTRNVMIGVLFLVYLALLLSILIPIAYLPQIYMRLAGRWGNLKSISSLITFTIGYLGFMYFPIMFAGSIFSAFYVHTDFEKADTFINYVHALFGLLLLAFDYRPILLAAGGFIFLIQLYNFARFFFSGFSFMGQRAEAISSSIYFGLIGTGILGSTLTGFANDIYPNLKFNFGGGQPQIAALTLSGKAAELSGWSGDSLCCKEPSDQAIKLPDAAIWFQSDKFIYVSFLPAQDDPPDTQYTGPAPVTAIDLKLVSKIVYLPKYVLISRGHIKSVHGY
jgi:hypothetical protein